ncbi:hypothetical protein PRELSG_1001800 [Plasmodium relictum]|uniref:phosphoglucomutase (alpha-D-glucose-1,6-bisphosphate-dependent) n=1 Tax=Plasmodium relictum TaxID=85471 RepID=A0A1J1H9U4_PLARL|nr:hypothetical protein PRELSG_1001800 [Plasmodium relictum]CRH00367.1 hypothetical protein PRELSG_1001800 [Plasmodium relictum]
MGNYITCCEKKLHEIDCTEGFFREKDKDGFTIIKTNPYDDQKFGPYGLRKETKIFMKHNYLHNIIQSLFNIIDKETLRRDILLISSDGRYFSDKAIHIICEIAAGNEIKHVIIPHKGLATAAACDSIIKNINEKNDSTHPIKKCFASIILTASHNAGGKNGVFGIKVNKYDDNKPNGEFLHKFHKETLKIDCIKKKRIDKIMLDKIKVETVDNLIVEIVNPVEDWINLMKKAFDFDLIKKLTRNKNFIFAYDAFHGATGEYAKELFVNELKLNDKFFFNLDNKNDFNKLIPDPNLIHARKLVDIMKIDVIQNKKKDEKKDSENKEMKNINEVIPDLAGVCSSDGSRCMILGRNIFVNPCDNLAIITHYAEKCIPYFKNNFLGVAKSYPTSKAVDKVIEKMNKNIYETPPGYKYFINLINDNKISIFGEESFGIGSSLIREKDGLFTILCWLSILAYKNNVVKNYDNSNDFISVKDIVHEFWKEYGRSYYTRYDFEQVDINKCDKMFEFLNKIVKNELPLYENVKELNINNPNHRIKKMETFVYIDHVSKEIYNDEGIKVTFENESSVIYRKSKDTIEQSTIRIYFEKFEKESIFSTNHEILEDLIYAGLKMCKIKDFIGTENPTVVI